MLNYVFTDLATYTRSVQKVPGFFFKNYKNEDTYYLNISPSKYSPTDDTQWSQ